MKCDEPDGVVVKNDGLAWVQTHRSEQVHLLVLQALAYDPKAT